MIQDVDIPLDRAAEFLSFLHTDIGIRPIWICPIRASTSVNFPLYPLRPGTVFINFGFWDTVTSRTPHPQGYLNRKSSARSPNSAASNRSIPIRSTPRTNSGRPTGARSMRR